MDSGHTTTDPVRMLQIGAEVLSGRPGGLNRYTWDIAHAFQDLPVDQHWFMMGDCDIQDTGVSINAVASSSDPLLKRWSALRSAFQKINKVFQADIVVTHFALYAFPLKKHLAKMSHVVHFHGPWAGESEAEGAGRFSVWGKRQIENAVFATANRFVTLSQAFADILVEQYRVDSSRIRVVPGAIRASEYQTHISRQQARQRLGFVADRPTVVCVRRLAKRMGLERLIQAMVLVEKQCPEVVLYIAGKGPLSPGLEHMIERESLQGSVELLGFVPDKDLPYLYRAADLSVVPSQSLEGFGLIILESLAAGTPAFVTPVGGMPEAVYGLDPNLILESTAVESIADGLIRGLNGGLDLPSSEACQDYVRQHHDWSVIAPRVWDVYREAIDHHHQ